MKHKFQNKAVISLQDKTAGGYLPASFLDWEGHVAPVIFISGCNFKCPWCHNSELVFSKTEAVKISAILNDIERRKPFLDGVVISGGEPTLSPFLIPLMHAIKALGLPIKLDTNGSYPNILKRILEDKLVDFIAMDIKAPLNDEDLEILTGVPISSELLKESVRLIKSLAPAYEFRTTYISELLSKEKLFKIREELNDDTHWVVQCFNPVNCISQECLNYNSVKREDIEKILPDIKVRG